MITPSLLEYSIPDLVKRLNYLQSNMSQCMHYAHQDILTLHIDCVCKRFAQDKHALMSNSLQTTLDTIAERFSLDRLHLSIHLMGDTEDLMELYAFLNTYQTLPMWSYTIFIPEEFYISWSQQFNSDTMTIGIWYDLNMWTTQVFAPTINYLLMTVPAGKSGQKALLTDKNKALNIARTNPQSRFIVDGGWNIDEDPLLDNLQVVSYSSFWSHI